MSGEDVVLAVGYRDPARARVAGDLTCAGEIDELVRRSRGQLLADATEAIVRHGQAANPALIAAAARAIGVPALLLAGHVAQRELRDRDARALLSCGRGPD